MPIRTTAGRKPEVAGAALHFSTARRGDVGAVAICRSYPVGVDVEAVNHLPAFATVAAEFFPPRAHQAYLTAPPHDRARQFALWWCRIEAAVKACGAGLDDAGRCLRRAPQQARTVGPGLAVAVGVRTSRPFQVEWLTEPAASDACGH